MVQRKASWVGTAERTTEEAKRRRSIVVGVEEGVEGTAAVVQVEGLAAGIPAEVGKVPCSSTEGEELLQRWRRVASSVAEPASVLHSRTGATLLQGMASYCCSTRAEAAAGTAAVPRQVHHSVPYSPSDSRPPSGSGTRTAGAGAAVDLARIPVHPASAPPELRGAGRGS